MRIFAITILCFLALLSCDKEQKLKAQPIDPKYKKTFSGAILEIEKKAGLEVTDKHYKILDEIINSADSKVQKKEKYFNSDVLNFFKTIADALISKGYSSSVKATNSLSENLLSKKMQCFTYSSIYYSIGEIMGYPVVCVKATTHMYVSWMFNDSTYINWETTNNKSLPDSFYIARYSIPKPSINKIFIKNLNKTEMMGYYCYALARVLEEKGQFKNAGLHYRKSFQLDPNNPEPRTNYGILLLKNYQLYEKANEQFKMALKIDPFYKQAYLNLGTNTTNNLKKPAIAESYFLKAIELDSGYSDAYYQLGDYYLILKKYKQAKNFFSKSIEFDSLNSNAYFQLGNMAFSNDKNAEIARDYFITAIETDNNNQSALYNLAMLNFTTFKNYEATKVHLEKLVNINPHHAEAHNRLGHLYEAIFNDPRTAASHYKMAKKIRTQSNNH